MLNNFILIFIGGGLGSVLRFSITDILNKQLPYGTFTANILGSLLIGLFIGLFEKQIIANSHLLLLAVGFCGGFTTFSSFAAENLKLLQQEAYLSFMLYALFSLIMGIAMVWLGFKLAKWV